MADRLNVFGHDQLKLMGSVVEGVASNASVSAIKDYSGGLRQRALGRTRPTHPKLHMAAWQIRQQL